MPTTTTLAAPDATADEGAASLALTYSDGTALSRSDADRLDGIGDGIAASLAAERAGQLAAGIYYTEAAALFRRDADTQFGADAGEGSEAAVPMGLHRFIRGRFPDTSLRQFQRWAKAARQIAAHLGLDSAPLSLELAERARDEGLLERGLKRWYEVKLYTEAEAGAFHAHLKANRGWQDESDLLSAKIVKGRKVAERAAKLRAIADEHPEIERDQAKARYRYRRAGGAANSPAAQRNDRWLSQWEADLEASERYRKDLPKLPLETSYDERGGVRAIGLADLEKAAKAKLEAIAAARRAAASA